MNERNEQVSSEALADPLIDEVRERRRELFEQYGNDPKKLLAALKALQDEHLERVVDRRRAESSQSSWSAIG